MQIIRTSAGNGALGAAAAGITAANAAMQGALDRRLQLDEQQVRSAMQMRQMRDRQAQAKMQQAYRAEQDMLRNERADEALRMQRERLQLDRERHAQSLSRMPSTRRYSQATGADIMSGLASISEIDPATGQAIMSNIQEIVGTDQPITPEMLDDHPSRAWIFQEITRAKDAVLKQATRSTIDSESGQAIKAIDALDPKFLQTDEGSTLVADLLKALESPEMTPERAEALVEGFERKAQAAITREEDRQKYLDIFTKASDGFASMDQEVIRDLKRSIAKADNPYKAYIAAKSMIDPDMREALDDQAAAYEQQLANERLLREQAARELAQANAFIDGMTGPDRKGKTGPPTPATRQAPEERKTKVLTAPGPGAAAEPSKAPAEEESASAETGGIEMNPFYAGEDVKTPVAPPTDGPGGPGIGSRAQSGPGGSGLRVMEPTTPRMPRRPDLATPEETATPTFTEEETAGLDRTRNLARQRNAGGSQKVTQEEHPRIRRAIILERAKAQGATPEQLRYLQEILERGLEYGSAEEKAFRMQYIPEARMRSDAADKTSRQLEAVRQRDIIGVIPD